jgi:Tfp pilus assembly protein PilP
MGRLQNKYLTGLFLSIPLALILSNTAPAVQNEESKKNIKPNEATVEPVKTNDIKSPGAATEPAKTNDIKPPEATSEPIKTYVTISPNNYIYDPTNKTDPFKSFLATREEQARTKAKTYLETLELSQLDLTVTVVSPKGKWAMVKDSKGGGHVIKEGTPIGTNNGVVYKISQGEVVIREEYKDFRGQTQYRDITKKAQ